MLEIIPAPADWLATLIAGDDEFRTRIGREVVSGWSGFPEALPHLLDAARRDPGSPWGPQLVLDDGVLVGVGGWKGPPTAAGEAELGYAVAPERQRRGVATWFTSQLIAAARHAGVATATAHTLAEDNPSTGVLRRCGFRHVATIELDDDPDADLVWRWERWLTRRTTIEPLDAGHAPGLVTALDHPDVGRYIGGPDVTTVDALLTRIERLADPPPGQTWLNWAVVLDDDPSRPVIGRLEATAYPDRPGVAEIAYLLGPAWWGRGLATEGVRWMLDHLAVHHAVTDVWASVDPANTASTRVLERCGFAPADFPAHGLGSYDDGDLVLRRRQEATLERR